MTRTVFLAVPVDRLRLDPVTSAAHGKYPIDEMVRWMAEVPALYDLQLRGTSSEDLLELSRSADPAERLRGDTFRHLFSSSPSACPLRADLTRGGALDVVAGQHRVIAARDQGVPLLPVHVTGVEPGAVERLRGEVEQQVGDRMPRGRDIVRLQRTLDQQIRPERGRARAVLPRSIDRRPGRTR